jgi:TolB-like protein/class 3 adenylate cyclase/cytochrome c-type biogenesis protein CcmH/NrfG
MTATRRLAAILAADVAGYSRLIGTDEGGTLQALKAIRAELIDPMIATHNGRLVKTTGDGLLVEFGSVVDALRCATEVQADMAERNATAPTHSRIEFRIGIHQGDVVIEDDDIFGDVVNVAARLEALAEPGGICVSGRVRGDAAGKLDLVFEDMGQQQLKNIARPVRVYALRPEGLAGVPMTGVSGGGLSLSPIVAPRLSIVVLPFANLGNDPEQQYFADAITEDLTTDLSRIADMLVISRNTAFTYQGKRVDTKQIGRELGARYVLEGSVQRSGNRVRINAQLIDAETDAHRWAERFYGDTSDLFALQDEITSRIAISLNLELVVAEAARPIQSADALDFVLHGRAAGLKPHSRDRYEEQIALFEHALTLDPQSAEAKSLLAAALASRLMNFGPSAYENDLIRAEALTAEALAIAPRDPRAHLAKGHVLRVQGRLEEAISEYEIVLASNPNWVEALAAIGRCKIYIGPIDEAIRAQERAIRLSPRDPNIGLWYFRIGQAHLLQSRTEEAILWFEKARGANPEIPFIRGYLASAYALQGQTEQAAAQLAEAQRLDGVGNFSSIAHDKRRQSLSQNRGARPEIRALFETTYFAGLRKAGMPEE